MDGDKFKNLNDPDALPGIIVKSASVSPLECTDEDLKKINKYALKPQKAEDVFIFKASIADNEQDDRNYMPFNLKALQDLKKLYPGKTMLKDHMRSADNQIARVYETELVQNSSKQTELGELHTELVAKMYMIRTDSNKDLIAEIEGGIKKEVSTSTRANKLVCNICKGDGTRCRHWPGMEYTIDDGSEKGTKRRCKMLMDGAKEAYELSFVAVPAQPRAGTQKSVGFTKDVDNMDPEENPENGTKDTENLDKVKEMDERIARARVKNAESFFYTKNESEEK